jgi:hypothetical protein
MFLLVFFQQIRCVDIIGWFPCVIALRVTTPLDQILQGMTVPKVSMALDCFDFILCFSHNKVQWWSREIGPVLCHLLIGR